MPLLELDNGERLTEGPPSCSTSPTRRREEARADRRHDGALPPAGVAELITSELHKSFSPLFNPAMPEGRARLYRTRLGDRFKVDGQLAGKNYLMGEGLQRRRRLPVRRRRLEQARRRRHQRPGEPRRLHGIAWARPGGAGSAEGRRAAEAPWAAARGPVIAAFALALASAAARRCAGTRPLAAQLCVAVGEAPPDCGPARRRVQRAPARRAHRRSPLIAPASSQGDVVLMHGTMQIDGFFASYEWDGTTLRFLD